jgi:hypothetical protein
MGHKPNIPCSGEPFLSSHLFLSMSEQKYISAILKGFLRKVKEISEKSQVSLITPIMKQLRRLETP